MKGKAHGWWTFPKCGVGLGYHLILGPYFVNAPTLGLYPTLNSAFLGFSSTVDTGFLLSILFKKFDISSQ